MAILLEFKYDKRLGLLASDSHDFGVSMRTEVNNMDQIQEESERAYRLLQKSVDAQLHNPGFIASENGKEQRGEENQTEKTDPQQWNCTERQRGLILKIIGRNLPESEVDRVAQEVTGRRMYELQKGQASLIVGEILDRWGKHRRTDLGGGVWMKDTFSKIVGFR